MGSNFLPFHSIKQENPRDEMMNNAFLFRFAIFHP